MVRSWVRHVIGRRSVRRSSAQQEHRVELLEERQLLDATASALLGITDPLAAHYVTGLYKNLLHRTPQQSELANWVGSLAAGQSREQVAQQFISSPEYRSHLISEDYRNIVGRRARPKETSDWLRSLEAGMDERQIRAKLLASKAYTGDQLNDSRSWLTSVYEDILGRSPEPSGANFWQQALKNGVSRENVALGIVDSAEASTRIVVNSYRDILGRNPDASGLKSLVAGMGQGLTPSGLNRILVSSPEYFDKQTHVVHTVLPTRTGGRSGQAHATMFDVIPDFASEPTIVSIASGDWSDPGIWSEGTIPTDEDVVVISEGTTVSYDVVSEAHIQTVDIAAGGHLHFRTDQDTQLIVANFVVDPDGDLEIGTESDPVAADVTAQVIIADQPTSMSMDPQQYGTGLIGLGKVTIHGAEKTGFMRLAVEPVEGDTTLILEDPVSGWREGDSLFLPDTRALSWNERYQNYVPQWEEVEIQSISDDGRVVILSEPLAFDHLGARNPSNGVLESLPHVMNRSRNVTIESENEDGTRGHTIFTEQADVDIRYAEFSKLGRTTTADIDNTVIDLHTGKISHIGTNQIGRYPLHMHHLMGPEKTPKDGYQFTLVGNAVDGGGGDEVYPWKWGITIHGSHYGLVEDNVVYDVAGAGIVTEDGSESFNVIEHNFVGRVHGTGEQGDSLARAGSAFWFRGPNNYVRDNVAADLQGYVYAAGFNYSSRYLGNQLVPDFPGADPMENGHMVNMNATPLLEFADNEVYGASPTGVAFWWLGCIEDMPLDAGQSVVKNFRAWNIFANGVQLYPTNNVLIDGMVLRGAPVESDGIFSQTYSNFQLIIRNSDIQGFDNGIQLPRNGDSIVVEDSYLRNQVNVLVRSLGAENGPHSAPPLTAVFRNDRFEAPTGMPLKAVVMQYFTIGSHLIQSQQVLFYDYNGVAGDDFQVYYWEQAPDFIVPQTSPGTIGSPVAGLTNLENWRRFGIDIAGAIAPVDRAVDRPEFYGFVVPL